MTIIGIAGDIGSGKSFTQLKHGLKYVEQREKQLVTNFEIDVNQLRKYASLPREYQSAKGYIFFNLKLLVYVFRYSFCILLPFLPRPKKPKIKPLLPWVKRLCEKGGIIQIPSPDNLQSLIIPDSVVLLDEAGVLLNSRDFANTPKKLLADLAQSRKDGTDLIWCAQFSEQVDRQMRLLTQFWIHCDSISVYDKKMRRPRLHYKKIFWFRCSDYWQWINDPRARGSFLRTKFVFATIYEGGFLTKADKLIFNVFNSFSRLDVKNSNFQINSIHQCKLPRDYYFNKLDQYDSIRDPMTTDYDSESFPKHQPVEKILSDIDDVINTVDKSQLIREAIKLSKSKNVKLPYLKDMSALEIKNIISNISR